MILRFSTYSFSISSNSTGLVPSAKIMKIINSVR
jgi:hypothetical protein